MIVVLLVVALGGVVAAVAALVALHALPTGLSPLRDPVSAYGISRYAGLYRLQTVGTAVAALALAVALPVSGVDAVTPAVVVLAVLAITRGVISWVPMDAEGEPRSTTGRLHNLLAFGAFAAASVGGFMVGIAFGATDGLQLFAPVVTVLGWGMSAASALTIIAGVVRGLRPIFGLAERLIYVGMFAWLVVTGVALLGR